MSNPYIYFLRNSAIGSYVFSGTKPHFEKITVGDGESYAGDKSKILFVELYDKNTKKEIRTNMIETKNPQKPLRFPGL